jgi:hypothetical protein
MRTVCGTATEPSMIRDAPCSRNVYLSHHCDPLPIQGLEIRTPPLKRPLDLIEKGSVTASCELGVTTLHTKGDLMPGVWRSQMSAPGLQPHAGTGLDHPRPGPLTVHRARPPRTGMSHAVPQDSCSTFLGSCGQPALDSHWQSRSLERKEV